MLKFTIQSKKNKFGGSDLHTQMGEKVGYHCNNNVF